MIYDPPVFDSDIYGLNPTLKEELKRRNEQPQWARRRWLLERASLRQRGADDDRSRRFLYKYLSVNPDTSADGLELKKLTDLLVRGELYLSSTDQFNDPNDFRAVVEFTKDPDSLQAWATRLALSNASLQGASPSQLKQVVSSVVARALDNPQMIQGTYDQAAQAFGVYCLSQNPRSHLMWAHYSRSHRGLCVQLDPARCLEVFAVAQTVRYTKDIPHITWPDDQANVLNGALSKSDEWNYESEVRYINRQVKRASIKFDANAATGVILGQRFNENTRATQWLADAIRERRVAGLPELKLYRAVRDPKSYALAISRIKTID